MSQFNLNERQREAVEYQGGDLLIIAGAGTGKTQVLTKRVLFCIEKDLAKPSEILALTYTDKAAQEMLDRVDSNMSYGYEQPLISTFHSFCDKILREDGYNIGIDSGYSLMSKSEGYIFLRKHFDELPFNRLLPKGNPQSFIKDFQDHISKLQDEDITPEDYISFASKLPRSNRKEEEDFYKYTELANSYKVYRDLKLKESKVDFGDLIILTTKLFRERPNVLDKYRKMFKYILVDEFQDTNFTQNVLINSIVLGLDDSDSSIRPLLTVVGDDDQSIYKFRGAAISNILQFKQTYPDAKEVVLVENYRSKQEILDSSYTLIRHNDPNRLEVTENIDKRLIAMGVFDSDEDAVSLIVANNEENEADRVTDEILKLTGYASFSSVDMGKSQLFDEKGQSTFINNGHEGKFKFSDIAILVRAGKHEDSFLQTLRFKGIPYKLGGSRGLYFRKEIMNLISFLRVLVNCKDEISMFNLLMMPIWNLSPREYRDLINLAKEERNTLSEELESLWGVRLGCGSLKEEDFKNIDKNNLIEKVLSAEAIAGISSLLMILDKSLVKIKDGCPISTVLYDFISESGYLHSFMDIESSENIFAVGNIGKFFELVKKYEKDNMNSNIFEYVDYLNYCIENGESPLVDQTDMDELNAVNIMTVHGSKGLEFPVVFLVSLVNQRFPGKNRNDPIVIPKDLVKEIVDEGITGTEANLQEERRLFYVGATRAKEKLYLTCALFYDGGKQKRKPSVFLNEILDRDVSVDFSSVDEASNKVNFSIRKGLMEDDYESISKDFNKKDLIKKFSYSRYDVYDRCPRRYEYAHVLNVPTRPDSSASFGSTVHRTLKDFYSLLMKSKEGLDGIVSSPSLDELLSLYEKNWVSSGYSSKRHESIQKSKGAEIMKNYFEKVYSEKEQPFKLEESFSAIVGDVVFTGTIDRIDTVSNSNGVHEVCIVDYKTGKDKNKSDINRDLQLPLYAFFAEEKLGLKVVGAKYIFVVSGNTIDVDVSEERMEVARNSVLDAVEKIRDGKFAPTPGFGCNYCDYRSVCKYAE